ncbi:glycosyl hydrolase [Aspergillus filifer]
MSWGHITSKDLISWTSPTGAALFRGEPYDCEGAFTGCMVPPRPNQKSLKVIYSSVCHLPFHWSTPPYPRNAAGLAIAESTDGGKTWRTDSRDPILVGEPEDLLVTGFRDSFLAEWPPMQRLRGHDCLYGLVAGGIEGHGPTAFLYSVPHDSPSEWQYLCPLVDMPARFQPSQKWSGNFGVNGECVNFLTLKSEANTRTCLILGAEGDVERDHVEHRDSNPRVPRRTTPSLLWMFGNLRMEGSQVRLDYTHGGYLDCGSLYAANSFVDDATERNIMHAWIPEEDITERYAKAKGWNGALAIPREVFLLSIPNIARALHTPLAEIESFEALLDRDGSSTIHTLGVRPVRELDRQRTSGNHVCQGRDISVASSTIGENMTLCWTSFPSWELEATIALDGTRCLEFGFHIRHNSDMSICTTVTFSHQQGQISVNKEKSTRHEDVRNCPGVGPFTLFYLSDTAGVEPQEVLEKLRIRIVSDADVLEVFANDRFALATTVYSQGYFRPAGISAFAIGEQGCAFIEKVDVWDGLVVNQE